VFFIISARWLCGEERLKAVGGIHTQPQAATPKEFFSEFGGEGGRDPGNRD
jgi:hypothetical protein